MFVTMWKGFFSHKWKWGKARHFLFSKVTFFLKCVLSRRGGHTNHKSNEDRNLISKIICISLKKLFYHDVVKKLVTSGKCPAPLSA